MLDFLPEWAAIAAIVSVIGVAITLIVFEWRSFRRRKPDDRDSP